MTKGNRMMRYIPIYKKSPAVAVQDWRQLITKHLMSIVPSKREVGGEVTGYADRSKDVGIISGEPMLNFYELVREICTEWPRYETRQGRLSLRMRRNRTW